MTEQKEYAIIRFFDQGSQCLKIDDVTVGANLLQYMKEASVSKRMFYKWFLSLAEQLELYRKNAKQPYGHVNPYAVIVGTDGETTLLDIEAKDNSELLKRMQKKSSRAAFGKDNIMSQTEPEEDIYGFGRLMLFVLEKGRFTEEFSYVEKIKLNKIVEKCVRGKGNTLNVLRACKKELEHLYKSGEKKIPFSSKMLGIGLTLIILIVFSVLWKGKGTNETENVESTETTMEVTELAEPVSVLSEAAEFMTIELAMLYYAELDDHLKAREILESIEEISEAAGIYLQLFDYIQNGKEPEGELGEDLWNRLATELERLGAEHKLWYYFPMLEACKIKDTNESWSIVCEIGESIRQNKLWNGLEENLDKKKMICSYLSKAYERLEQREYALNEYEYWKDLETESSELMIIYLKILELNEQIEDTERKSEIIHNILEEAAQRIPEMEDNAEFREWKLKYAEEVQITDLEETEE